MAIPTKWHRNGDVITSTEYPRVIVARGSYAPEHHAAFGDDDDWEEIARLIAKAPEMRAEIVEEGTRVAQWYATLKVLYDQGHIRGDAAAADVEDILEGLAISGDKFTTLLAEIDG